MKKIVLLVAAVISFGILKAQDGQEANHNSNIKTVNIKSRPGDHLMLQFGYSGWSNMPDSISSHRGGINVGFNGYFMFDKVFKSNPKMSVGFGLGYSTGSVRFKKMNVGMNETTAMLPFHALDNENHFKKYKITTSYVEVPIELRYTSRPENYNKSLKAAVGLKVGLLVNANSKGKTLVNGDGRTVMDYVEKIKSKRYINSTRFMATSRVGYGIFNVFFNYGLSNVLKDGVGPEMKPFQVGLAISGL